MTQQSTTYGSALTRQEQDEYNIQHNNTFSLNNTKDIVVPDVPPRNVGSRPRAQSLFIDNDSRYQQTYKSGLYDSSSSAKLSYSSSPLLTNDIIPPQAPINYGITQNDYSSEPPPPPQRQINVTSHQSTPPQPPAHGYSISVNTRNSIYQPNDMQNQMPLLYQTNRIQQQNITNDSSDGNYSYPQNNSHSPIKKVRSSSLFTFKSDFYGNDQLGNPNPSNPNVLPTTTYNQFSSNPLPSAQNSNYQKTSPEYNPDRNSFPSPVSSLQNQIPQNYRPLPSNPQSSNVNRSSTVQIGNNNSSQSNTNTTPTTLSTPVRVTSMIAKPGHQYVYRSQTISSNLSQSSQPNQHNIFKSHSSSQLSSQSYYQSPTVQPSQTSGYMVSSQYFPNGKISPSVKPQRSPQLIANRNGSYEEGMVYEGPSIPPRKVKPRYGSTSSYYSSPSLTGLSYSPRIIGLKNESDYDNYRNGGRPMSMMSFSSENIVELSNRMSNKGPPFVNFSYRNNSRSSVCSAPDLHNAFYNSNLDAIPQEGNEFNNYMNNNNINNINGNANKYYKYPRSVHGYSMDDSSSEFVEGVGHLKTQYGSTNSLNNLMKYDHLKIESMFMDDEVYQIGDLRDKYPLVDHSPLLSEIASDFHETISLVCHIKDNIEYLDCFSGEEAVTLLAEILGTEDRKVALLTGQILEENGMFHDVVYMHKLMDNKDMFYQMHTLALPLAGANNLDKSNSSNNIMINNISNDSDLQIKNMSELSLNEKKKKEENKISYPTGVLVNIAQCYSPTCFEDSPCYSYSCPKRRIYEKVVNKKVSLEHIKTTINNTLPLQNTWSTSIGKPYIKKMEKKEIKRQEIIYEFIQTEKEYVEDLFSVKTKIMEPLAEGRVPKIGEEFVRNVFNNIDELYEVNKNFYDNIRELQKRKPILESIGDIVKDFVPNLYCYERYGRSQPRAKHILQIEKNNNKNLNNFFKNAQYKPEFRRLPIESFLARPTTRLGRYPILLKDIIKNTPEGHRDIILLNDALQGIENILKEVNNQAGRATNKLKLEEWSLLLESERKDDISMLRLENPDREFIREGKLELKRYANESQNHSNIPITLVLLDNMLIITKPKVNSIEIYKKPIPLQLLSIIVDENNENGVDMSSKHKRSSKSESQKYYTFTLVHQGVGSYSLQTTVYSDQKSWIECIKKQQSKFKKETITKMIPLITNPGTKIIAANYVSNILFLLATENGVYIQSDNKMKLVLPLSKISHMEVMLQYKLLFIIANKEVYPFNIDLLVNGLYITKPSLRKIKKLCSNVTFIAVGRCDDRDLLCCVKTTSLNSTIKIYAPKGDGLIKLQQNKSLNDSIILYKQFYIPSEARTITFLKKSLCIGCIKGFEVVDINTLTTQSLLSNNSMFDFVLKSDNIPIRMFRTPRQDFLLLYSKVGFYLDKNGNRSRPDIIFRWFGTPTTFAYCPPYIISFEHNSISIWEENSPEVVKQIIPSNSLKLLYENNNQILITEMKNQLQVISILHIAPYQYYG